MAKPIRKSLMIKAKTQSKRDRKAAATKTRRVSKDKKAKKSAAKAAIGQSAVQSAKAGKWVYAFGDGKADGKSDMKNLLGGKGANLAEMANLGLPVPPGFTITSDVCTYFYGHEKTYPRNCRRRSMPRWRASARLPARCSAMRRTRCWCPCAPARAPRCRA